jgi:cyanate permease
MWLLILEALAALAILAFAVWWTMFSGRKRRDDDPPGDQPPKP